MSSLKVKLNDDLKEAMKAKEVARRDTLRGLLAAVRQVEVDTQKEVDDEGLLKILGAEAKRRRESIDAFTQGGRTEDANNERNELTLIESYLPQQLSRAELEAIVDAVIAETGVTSAKDMGKIMGPLMARVKGQADGKLVNEVVRSKLS
jgi:uncharacterized protein